MLSDYNNYKSLKYASSNELPLHFKFTFLSPPPAPHYLKLIKIILSYVILCVQAHNKTDDVVLTITT